MLNSPAVGRVPMWGLYGYGQCEQAVLLLHFATLTAELQRWYSDLSECNSSRSPTLDSRCSEHGAGTRWY